MVNLTKKKKFSKKISKKQNVKRRCKSLKHRGGANNPNNPKYSKLSTLSNNPHKTQNPGAYNYNYLPFTKYNSSPNNYSNLSESPSYEYIGSVKVPNTGYVDMTIGPKGKRFETIAKAIRSLTPTGKLPSNSYIKQYQKP